MFGIWDGHKQEVGTRISSRPEMLSLERPACKFRPWLVSGSLDFILGGFPPLPDKSGSQCLNNMVYAKHLLSIRKS